MLNHVYFSVTKKEGITSIVLPHYKMRFSKDLGLVNITDLSLKINRKHCIINIEYSLDVMLQTLHIIPHYKRHEERDKNLVLAFEILKCKINDARIKEQKRKIKLNKNKKNEFSKNSKLVN